VAISFKEIKELTKSRKAREEQGLFVTEGTKGFEETPPELIRAVFTTGEWARANAALLEKAPPSAEITADVRKDRFAGLCGTKTPQGVLCVAEMPKFDMQSAFAAENPLIAVLEDVQDPGNVGTIIRTCEAAGADAVFLTRGSADPYSPKTVRATMGSVFRTPHFLIDDMESFMALLDENGIAKAAALPRAEAPYFGQDLTRPLALFIGNEGNGLRAETAAAADVALTIPMAGKVESLNAAMAASVLLFEAARQRSVK